MGGPMVRKRSYLREDGSQAERFFAEFTLSAAKGSE
jgi:hypothetical protein